MRSPKRIFAAPLAGFLLAAAAAAQSLPATFERFVTAQGELFASRGPGRAVQVSQRGIEIRVVGPAGELEEVSLSPRDLAPGSCLGGEGPLATRSHYILGGSADHWTTQIPHFESVRWADVHEGVDLVFRHEGSRFKYDVEFAPGSTHSALVMDVQGSTSIRVEEGRGLLIATPQGCLVQPPPVAFQVRGEERVPVEVRYVALENGYTFDLGPHDSNLGLVIDPFVDSLSYLGGAGEDTPLGVDVDAQGNTYVTGRTMSLDFPVSGGVQPSHAGSWDVFVTKVDPTGTSIIYSTYVGGSGVSSGLGETGFSIAVDGNGSAHVTGTTASADFPLVNPAQATPGGGDDAFLFKLDPSGSSLLFSTLLGGSGDDVGFGVALDAAGNVSVAGSTTSADLPLLLPLDTTLGGSQDAFVAGFAPSGALRFSTFHGGASVDAANGVAAGPGGQVIVAGLTSSSDFPVTPGAYQQWAGRGFVSSLTPDGSALAWSTWLPETSTSVAVDGAGRAFTAGTTNSCSATSFGSYQPSHSGSQGGVLTPYDAFALCLSADGSSLVWGSYFGSSTANESVTALAVDGAGHAVLGVRVNPPAPQPSVSRVVQFNVSGSALILNHLMSEEVSAIAAPGDASLRIVGQSPGGLAVTPGAFQPTYGGGLDGYVLNLAIPATQLKSIRAPSTMGFGDSAEFDITLDGAAPAGGATVTLSATPSGVLSLPSSVVVPAGEASVIVPATAQAVAAPGNVQITGTWVSSRNASVFVDDGPAYRLQLVAPNPAGSSGLTGSVSSSGLVVGSIGNQILYGPADAPTLLGIGSGRDVSEQGVLLGTTSAGMVLYSPPTGFQLLPSAKPDAISSDGTLVTGTDLGSPSRAFRLPVGGAIEVLPLPATAGPTSLAEGYDVNSSGIVVGKYQDAGFAWRAFRSAPGAESEDLGLLSGYGGGYANAINDQGVIVGWNFSGPFNAPSIGFLYDPVAGLSPLAPVPGYDESAALDINNSGYAVGYSRKSFQDIPVLWKPDGSPQLLSDLIPPAELSGHRLTRAIAVSDAGHILVEGIPDTCEFSGTSADAYFLLTPNPTAFVYGCGLNPAASLTVLSGTASTGQTLTLGLDNPLGTQAPGALPSVLVATAPDPAYPCGSSIPGFGMSGPGEGLLSVSSLLPYVFVGPPWAGPGNPAPVDIAIPGLPALSGFEFFLQGVLIDPTASGSAAIGLTDGVRLLVGP